MKQIARPKPQCKWAIWKNKKLLGYFSNTRAGALHAFFEDLSIEVYVPVFPSEAGFKEELEKFARVNAELALFISSYEPNGYRVEKVRYTAATWNTDHRSRRVRRTK